MGCFWGCGNGCNSNCNNNCNCNGNSNCNNNCNCNGNGNDDDCSEEVRRAYWAGYRAGCNDPRCHHHHHDCDYDGYDDCGCD